MAESGEDFLDDDLCCGALAAAEIVAAAKGKPTAKPLPDNVANWLATHKLEVTPELNDLSVRAVTRIRKDPELNETWEEGGSGDAWRADVDDLLVRLG